MDLSKSYEFFNPDEIKDRIHIIGCGSVGSTIAENLARCGLTKLTLWDFDIVEEKNVVNQMFVTSNIGKQKVDALKDIICAINPEAEKDIKLMPKGWNGETLDGFVFMAVDSIEIRKEIISVNRVNQFIQAVFDVRTLLTSAQHYAAKWSSNKEIKNLIRSMDFTSEEADEETPVSACGITLGVATTVRIVSALAVNNFMNFVKEGKLWKFVNVDGFIGVLDCF